MGITLCKKTFQGGGRPIDLKIIVSSAISYLIYLTHGESSIPYTHIFHKIDKLDNSGAFKVSSPLSCLTSPLQSPVSRFPKEDRTPPPPHTVQWCRKKQKQWQMLVLSWTLTLCKLSGPKFFFINNIKDILISCQIMNYKNNFWWKTGMWSFVGLKPRRSKNRLTLLCQNFSVLTYLFMWVKFPGFYFFIHK